MLFKRGMGSAVGVDDVVAVGGCGGGCGEVLENDSPVAASRSFVGAFPFFPSGSTTCCRVLSWSSSASRLSLSLYGIASSCLTFCGAISLRSLTTFSFDGCSEMALGRCRGDVGTYDFRGGRRGGVLIGGDKIAPSASREEVETASERSGNGGGNVAILTVDADEG